MLLAINDRTAKIGIIGLGYVGLPLALVYQHAGFHVTGFDNDVSKVTSLAQGRSYIQHIGAETVAEAVASGRFQATTDFDRLAALDAILICVPTPLTDKREPDVSFIENAGREIARRLRPGQLIVLESSTYPGTTEEVLLPLLEASGVRCRAELKAMAQAAHASASVAVADTGRAYVAYSPEREDPGNRDFTTRTIPKLVGGIDPESGALALALYSAAFESAVGVSSARVAEMAKILENTYRCVNIALVNELKQLCLRMGIDIFEVIEAAATKPFGFHPFYPGPGLGGHCIPIDPFYLSWKAHEFDFTTRFIQLAGEINTEMPYKVVEAITTALNRRRLPVDGARILILGVAYKKDIDDLRESPALKVIELLSKLGAEVNYHDPHCPRVWRGRHNDFEMASIPFIPADAAQFDCVAVLTDHTDLDYRAIACHARLLIDTRNATRGLRADNVVHC
ncbi:MAG: nucleotide sugar dehydrogenase [Acidobacteria bacterium]|nr:MAG: nucleotide sugar dehydrogenase [Acidobacteriota bacterium]